ncbi:MAG: glycogen/starch/alpha-glucan phosphorylase [Sphingomonas bacterium]|nr:glycogen/starch/alpha-glucan phosphorylase [Sphingomonas bacterium]
MLNDAADAGVATSGAAEGRSQEVAELAAALLAKLTFSVGKDPSTASERDWFVAAALATRDRIVDGWMVSTRRSYAEQKKRVYYLSLEFLIGRLLGDALNNLQLTEPMRAALAVHGVDLARLEQVEPDAALGNGGLGRLAACFMDSMATLSIAAYGYGIRYQHGLFRQLIENGWQHEVPETWLSFGNPWEFERAEVIYPIGFGGTIAADGNDAGAHHWTPGEVVSAVAYDTPIVGWRGAHVNTLRLWSARGTDPIQLEVFNRGDYVGASAARTRARSISQVLYPSDDTPAGQELRLRQEYFFSSASLQDLVHRHLDQYDDLRTLPDRAAIQLNATHPSIAIAELMRLAIDHHGLGWDEAWDITVRTFSYTNHTLLPEALERWPVELMERLLPRHMQIIYLINARHLEHLRAGGHGDAQRALSIIDEDRGRTVRMGTLSFVGSHKVNGVSALHSQLMRETVFRDLDALYPGRIVNKTNGITFRRWLHEANPALTRMLVETIGPRVLDDAGALDGFAQFADDPDVQARFAALRRTNKQALAALVFERLGVLIDPDALFDVQIKRIHEYKRQLLNLLETIAAYLNIKADPDAHWVPRVKLFAGKAAASYHRAKLIIKLANDVAAVINDDPDIRGRLKLAFIPNYNVSLAQVIIPAADLSEQISTAGTEASGTGNMKLALNGALTIGTYDGANIELHEHIGGDNMFIFGMRADAVAHHHALGLDCSEAVAASPSLRAVLRAVGSGMFSPDEPGRYRGLVDALVFNDPFLTACDFDAYRTAQADVADRWRDPRAWWRSAILNTARVGWFSSDRTIGEYAAEIWDLPAGYDPG